MKLWPNGDLQTRDPLIQGHRPPDSERCAAWLGQPGTYEFLWSGDGTPQFGPRGGSVVVAKAQSSPVFP